MKVLLVSPVFHGYWKALANALAELGHEVTSHCYDAANGRGRMANAVAQRLRGDGLAGRIRESASQLAVRALQRGAPDAVLIVKGDALTDTWWDALSRTGTQSAVWLYDELERMRYAAETLRVASSVSSYSRLDTLTLQRWGIKARHVPDGYDSLTPFAPRASNLVSFVGARYPERERLMKILDASGEHVEVYGREWSRHPWDIVRTRRWRSAGITAHRDINRTEYYGVMAGSVATLNIHGAGHDGLSMRTFEAPGVGALQLIDRPDVSDHYEVGTETLVFTSPEELRDQLTRARREPHWAQSIRAAGRKRTLAEHTLVHRMREVTATWA